MNFISLLCVLATASIVPDAYPQSVDFPRFRLIHGNLDGDRLPTTGAKLCLLASLATCYVMPQHKQGEGVTFEFGLDPRSQRLPLAKGGSWVFFSAKYSGGGSGTLDRLAVLSVEPKGALTNLLPYVAVTNQSDRAIWTLPQVADDPVLAIADFYWDFDAKETHFAPHRYDISAYRYDPAKKQYAGVVSYRTTKKYPGLDDRTNVRVLALERDEIIRRLNLLR